MDAVPLPSRKSLDPKFPGALGKQGTRTRRKGRKARTRQKKKNERDPPGNLDQEG